MSLYSLGSLMHSPALTPCSDDCWIADNRTADGKLTHDPTRFPHGMAWLAEQAHSRDLKLGLYMAVSKETCRDYPGSQGHIITDANTFAEWGADFVKVRARRRPDR